MANTSTTNPPKIQPPPQHGTTRVAFCIGLKPETWNYSVLPIKRLVTCNSFCKRRTCSANCSWLGRASLILMLLYVATHWSADAFERPLDINLIHIGANKQADCRIFIICLISLLSQHDAAKAPTKKAMEILHQPGGVFRNSILHQPGAFLQDIDFQFFYLPSFIDGLHYVELHFERIITFEKFEVMAPCQFVRNRLTFWECKIELTHICEVGTTETTSPQSC